MSAIYLHYYIFSPLFSEERAHQPSPTRILQLPLSPLKFYLTLPGGKDGSGRASSGIPQHALWRGGWVHAGLSLSLECGVLSAFGSQLWAQPPFWDKRKKLIWQAVMSLFEASTFSLPKWLAFCMIRESVHLTQFNTVFIKQRAGILGLTLALCKYPKILFFFFKLPWTQSSLALLLPFSCLFLGALSVSKHFENHSFKYLANILNTTLLELSITV